MFVRGPKSSSPRQPPACGTKIEEQLVLADVVYGLTSAGITPWIVGGQATSDGEAIDKRWALASGAAAALFLTSGIIGMRRTARCSAAKQQWKTPRPTF